MKKEGNKMRHDVKENKKLVMKDKYSLRLHRRSYVRNKRYTP